jgi:hypothetical protein
MQKLTITDFYTIIDNIRRHLEEISRLDNGLSLIMNDDDIYSGFGGKLLDNYIDLLVFIFDDRSELITWYVFENEFGKQKLKTEINGKEVSIDNTDELFRQLYFQMKRSKRRKRNEKP